jgi:hypothetical protein
MVPISNLLGSKFEDKFFYKTSQNNTLTACINLLTIKIQLSTYMLLIHCKKFDKVDRHPHLVTQDQFSLVSKKDSGNSEDNLTINIEVFRQTFKNVEFLRVAHSPRRTFSELLRQRLNLSKMTQPGRELTFS